MPIVTDDIEIEEAAAEDAELWEFVSEELRQLENPQTAIAQLAKDAGQMRVIEAGDHDQHRRPTLGRCSFPYPRQQSPANRNIDEGPDEAMKTASWD